MRVELDLFSGRTNPTWMPDPATAAAIAARWRALPPTTGAGPMPPALGYRGFVIETEAGESRVFAGRVGTPDGVRIDAGRTLERELLATMPDEWAALRGVVEAAWR